MNQQGGIEEKLYATTTMPLKALQIALEHLKESSERLHDSVFQVAHANDQLLVSMRLQADEYHWAADQIRMALAHVERFSEEAPRRETFQLIDGPLPSVKGPNMKIIDAIRASWRQHGTKILGLAQTFVSSAWVALLAVQPRLPEKWQLAVALSNAFLGAWTIKRGFYNSAQAQKPSA